MRTRGLGHSRPSRRSSSSSTSVPDPGRARDRGPSAVPAHAPHDRLAHAAPVSRDRGHVEARAAVAHEHVQPLGRDLGEHVDGRPAAELRRVGHGFAGSRQHGLGGRIERGVAHRHGLHGHAVAALHLSRGGLERRAETGGLARCGTAGEPRAQLALLAPRERRHLARVVGAALHHRQRLEHRVVQVRRHLGTLLGADPRGALGGERAHEADDPGREDHAQHDDHGEDREEHVLGGAQRARGLKEGEARGDHERHAHACPRHGHRRGARGLDRIARGLRGRSGVAAAARGLLGGSGVLAPRATGAR